MKSMTFIFCPLFIRERMLKLRFYILQRIGEKLFDTIYISMGSSELSRRVLKSEGFLGLEIDNIYMVWPIRYKLYQS